MHHRTATRTIATLAAGAALALAAPAASQAQHTGAPDNPCESYQPVNGCHGPEWDPGFGEPGYGEPGQPGRPTPPGPLDGLLNAPGQALADLLG